MIIFERGDCPDDVIEAGEFSVFHEPEYCARLTVRCKKKRPVAETGILDVICPRKPLRCGLLNGIGGVPGRYLFNFEVPRAVIQDSLGPVIEYIKSAAAKGAGNLSPTPCY